MPRDHLTGQTSPVATRRRSRLPRDGWAPRRATWAPPSRLGDPPLLRSPPTPAGDVHPGPTVRRHQTQDPGASTPETSRPKESVTPPSHTRAMSDQLFRIDTDIAAGAGQARPPAWRLDEHTKKIGRDGIASARAALADSRSRYDHDDPIAA